MAGVSHALRRDPQEKLLALVVAFETLMNVATGSKADLSERFALWYAILGTMSETERIAAYEEGKRIYHLRSNVVHESAPCVLVCVNCFSGPTRLCDTA